MRAWIVTFKVFHSNSFIKNQIKIPQFGGQVQDFSSVFFPILFAGEAFTLEAVLGKEVAHDSSVTGASVDEDSHVICL